MPAKASEAANEEKPTGNARQRRRQFHPTKTEGKKQNDRTTRTGAKQQRGGDGRTLGRVWWCVVCGVCCGQLLAVAAVATGQR